MPADYTLTVIGNTPIARYAAARASQLGARVALVDAGMSACQMDANLPYDALIHLRRMVQGSARMTLGYSQLNHLNHLNHLEECLNWSELTDGVRAVTEQIQVEQGRSPAALTAAGVDVIVTDGAMDEGAFVPRPQLSFLVQGRPLRSRSFLLAPRVRSIIPALEGLSEIPHTTLDSLWFDWSHLPGDALPRRILILGADPRAIQLAQGLNHFGVQVTLLLAGDRLLPYEDAELSQWLRMLLETEGIQVILNAAVQRVERGETGLIVVSDRSQFEADFLVLGDRGAMDFSALNLAGVNVDAKPRLQVNARLQTTNPRIYACGECLGGYPFFTLAQYEANIVLHNVLHNVFSPFKKAVDYAAVPWVIQTDPAIARVGLTEQQARQRYGDDVVVLRRSLKGLAIAALMEQSSGFFKIILRRNGEILGAHGIGLGVADVIQMMAVAMQYHVRFQECDRTDYAAAIYADLLLPMVQQWQVQKLPRWQYDCRSAWWEWWRDRTR